MIPRKRLDIGWSDFLFGLSTCLSVRSRQSAESDLYDSWAHNTGSASHHSLACLSVRSGFDALLSALNLKPGDEVMVSAVTIPGMVHILEAHGLTTVPLDVSFEQLSVTADSLSNALTQRTRAILIAHLFGSRMDMQTIIHFAQQHDLFVIEDCAQAYAGRTYLGHPQSDVCLFSFGPIKTATALGGAMLCFKSAALCESVRLTQIQWPVQPRLRFFQRLYKYALLMALSYRFCYTAFVKACFCLRLSHDAVINRSVRGFSGKNFLARIRQQPSTPLIAMLQRRITRFNMTRISNRISLAQQLNKLTPSVCRPGTQASGHTHWVYPILSTNAEQLICELWRQGFDATKEGSSMCVVMPPGDRLKQQPTEALSVLPKLVYLPVHDGMSRADIENLADALNKATLHKVALHKAALHDPFE